MDVITKVLNNNNIDNFADIYESVSSEIVFMSAVKVLKEPLSGVFYYNKKLNSLLDIDVYTFNRAVFEYLKGTDYPVGKLDEFPLLDNEDIIEIDDVYQILEESGVGVPAYYNEIEFEVDGKKGFYNRSRSGCYFCFYQQKIEWIWLYEQHPDLYEKSMEFEKDGYTWIQGESLSDLIKPERIRQIKLDAIKKQEQEKAQKEGQTSSLLVDMVGTSKEDDILCANCFI